MGRGVLAWSALLLLMLLSTPAFACSSGDPSRRLLDEIGGYYRADVVFLARIGRVEEQPPGGADRHWMATAPYEVLEVYRGNPVPDGVVASEVFGKAGVVGVPPNSCMGGNLPTASQGGKLLVFASQLDRPGFPAYYKLDFFGSTLIDNCPDCGDVLERMRQYGKFERVPLLPTPQSTSFPSN